MTIPESNVIYHTLRIEHTEEEAQSMMRQLRSILNKINKQSIDLQTIIIKEFVYQA